VGRERRTLRGVELQADRVAEIAHRPVSDLRRRDVAIALLSVPVEDALASLPVIRRGLLAAGNPLSAPFWESAEVILQKITEHDATFGDVHGWLEATGTEPTGIIGLHVWEEPSARSSLQEEMHARLVNYLEERLAAGEIDPDRLATGDKAARQEYLALQERWMTTPLPDGRVPMTVLLDEQDEAFLADWAAADAEARAALQSVLNRVGNRPLPGADLGAAAARLRADIARPGWPGQMLVSFSGRTADVLPADDAELWLTLAASVASPQGGPLSEEDREFARAMEWAEDEDLKFGDDPDEVIGLKVAGADDAVGDDDDDPEPGGQDFDDGFDDYEDDFDELSIEGLFLHVTAMWSVLGAIDEDDRLTPLGWWGLPEAMRRAWTETE